MTRFLFVVLMLTGFIGSAKGKKFIIKGELPNSNGKYVVTLQWNSGEEEQKVKVINGRFIINGTIDDPIRAMLRLSKEDLAKEKAVSVAELIQNSLELFLDEGTITVISKLSLTDAEVKGSSIVNDFQSYHTQCKPLTQLLVKIYEAKSHYDNKGESSLILNQMVNDYNDLIYLEEMKFVQTHSSSPVSLYFVKRLLGYDMDFVKVAPMYSLLDVALLQSESGRKLTVMMELAKRTMIGVQAIDFTQPDSSGNNITLSSFKGKYVFVDFWASWCIPCRAEAPFMLKAYEEYRKSNFEVLGVSLDESKDKWLKAIQDDHYTWPQVGDLNGWENRAAREYGVRGIPFNLLIDPSGIIIARNLRGEELEKKLQEILK